MIYTRQQIILRDGVRDAVLTICGLVIAFVLMGYAVGYF